MFPRRLVSRRMLSAGAGSLAIKICHAALAFGVAVFLARNLGPAGYGAYSFALALIMLLAIPAQAGIPQLMVRETAKANAAENWGLLKGLWRWSNFAVFSFSMLSMLLILAIILISDDISAARLAALQAGILLIPLIALSKVRSAALRGLHHVVLGQMPDAVLRPFLHLLFVMGFVLVGLGMTVERAMLLHLAAALVAFVAGSLVLFWLRPKGLRGGVKWEYQWRSWGASVIPLGILASFQMANSYADVLILGIFRSDEEVGIYRAVFQIGLLVLFGLQSINQVLQPYLARYYSIGKFERLQAMVSKAALAVFGFATLAVLFLFLFGEFILSEVFGEAYARGYVPLMILAFGFWAKSFSGPSAQLLKMAGYERLAIKAALIAIVLNVVLNFIFVPMFGMTGAAGASAVSLAIWHFLQKLFCRRVLGINASASGFFAR